MTFSNMEVYLEGRREQGSMGLSSDDCIEFERGSDNSPVKVDN